MKDAQGHGSNPRGGVHAYNHWLQPDGTYKYGRKGSKAARYVESGAAAAAHQSGVEKARNVPSAALGK